MLMPSSDEDEFQPCSTARRWNSAARRNSTPNPSKKPRLSYQATSSSCKAAPSTACSAPPEAAPDEAAHATQATQTADPCAAPSAELDHVATCPICCMDLTQISHTAAGRAAHVNACLDAGTTAAECPRLLEAQLPADPRENDSVDLSAAEWPCIEGQDDAADMLSWLQELGAADLLEVFQEAEIDRSVLPHLNDNDLQELGISDIEIRARILRAAQQDSAGVAQVPPFQHGTPQQQLEDQQQCDVQDWEVSWIYSQDCGEEQWDALEPASPGPGQDAQHWQPCGQQQPYSADETRLHRFQQISQQQQQQREQHPPDPYGQQAQAEWHEHEDPGTDLQCQQVSQSEMMWIPDHHHQQQQGLCSSILIPQEPQQHPPHIASLENCSIPPRHPAHLQQSSVTGCVVQQTKPVQQQAGVKEQWEALFKRPRRPLGAHNPEQEGPARLRQAKLGAQGQVMRAAPTHPAALAAAAPRPALPQVPGPNLPRWWPAWRRIPGTNIIVDCFGRSSAAAGLNRTWVLTHFHADHYMGLTRAFKQGVIVCTPTTAALVKLKLRVPPERLLVLPLGEELLVEGTRLQFVDANHCPGAAMVVAHPPGNAPPVLHTGDARLTQEATRGQPVLQSLVGRAILVLDTTYADPAYCFPPQQQVLDMVLNAVKAELFNPRCLFLFGTYTIGKERLFLHVASALQRKVYVAAAKRSIMSCLDLPPHLSALLTTNHLDANIHAVPMRQVTLEAMESLLVRYKGRYTAVVGFKPTGWSYTTGSGRGGQVPGASRSSMSIKPNRRRSQRGTVVLYQVPYSEHSSCSELRSFVEWFKPLHIVPSVNNDGGAKLRSMLAAVTGPSRVTGAMDVFARQLCTAPAAGKAGETASSGSAP